MLEPGDLADLPGAEIVLRGIEDLAAGRLSVEALLVAIGSPRLRFIGIEIPGPLPASPEDALYEHLAREHGREAHGRYNAWLRRLMRFERAAEHHVYRERRLRRSAAGTTS